MVVLHLPADNRRGAARWLWPPKAGQRERQPNENVKQKPLHLFHKAVDRLHQLSDLFLPIPMPNGLAHTAIDVPVHHLQRHLIEGLARRRQLLNDVDAIAARFNHPADSPDLALNAP